MKVRITLFFAITISLISCQPEEGLEETALNKVLIIGNSITYHPPDFSIGWDANWGMAASRPELDYVSLLTDLLTKKYPSIEVVRENVYPFERNYDNMGWDAYSHLRDFEPDVLIVRLGENVDAERFEGDNFKNSLHAFVAYLTGAREVNVVVTTTFWENVPVTEQLVKAGEESGWTIVNLYDLGQDDRYMAIGRFENAAVSRHPNDLGMEEIAKRIWDALQIKKGAELAATRLTKGLTSFWIQQANHNK